jgi:release factor glutamine methyltransferase
MQDLNLGKPLAYILGHQEFWSLDLMVNEDVLIPRPETELLVESILDIKLHQANLTIADLGTGSGAIALALAASMPNATVYATDLSEKAIAIAKLNAERLSVKNIHFVVGDWFSALPAMQFDVIVSNPPYVGRNDPFLAKNVADYEPHLALFAENDGLKAINDIIHYAPAYLKPGGHLFLEHGFQQAERISNIFAEVGYTDMTFKKDLAGLDRVIFACWSVSKDGLI